MARMGTARAILPVCAIYKALNSVYMVVLAGLAPIYI